MINKRKILKLELIMYKIAYIAFKKNIENLTYKNHLILS